MNRYDALVIGTGGVGSAALYHLARRGARVAGIDRFAPGHDRGSSHGQSRLIRQAYYEHPDYVPLVLRAYQLWSQLEQTTGRRLLHPIGLLQVGPAAGAVLAGVEASARAHQIGIERLTADEIVRRWPGFRIPAAWSGLYEPQAGYLEVEAAVRAHAEQAVRCGAELHLGHAALGWQRAGDDLVVRTEAGSFVCDRLIVTAGAWAAGLLADLAIALEVRRKPLFWFAAADAYRAADGCPAFLFETTRGLFYGVPAIDRRGVKLAEHTGGQVVSDPLTVDRRLDPHDERRVAAFAAEHLPALAGPATEHTVCLYTMSPDEHFVVDRHPREPRVVFAAGLSGHGFKFAPVLGEALADLALDGRTALPIGFLSADRPGLRAAAVGQ